MEGGGYLLYRALRDLDVGIKRGELFRADRISQRAIPVLVERGIIALVAAPPLRELPIWNDRQPALGEGVETLADVVELDPANYRNPGEVADWQREAKALLRYPAPDGWYLKDPAAVTENCGGCPGAAKPKRKARRMGNRRT